MEGGAGLLLEAALHVLGRVCRQKKEPVFSLEPSPKSGRGETPAEAGDLDWLGHERYMTIQNGQTVGHTARSGDS